MREHFVFYAIDAPTQGITGGNVLPCAYGMLEVNEENPSPRVFNLEGDHLLKTFEGSVLSLISQIVPERREEVVKHFEARKQKAVVEKPQTYIRRFAELKSQSDFDEICLKRQACAIAVLPAIYGVSAFLSDSCRSTTRRSIIGSGSHGLKT